MEFQKQQAIYQQIADYMCEKILLKVWKSDDRIPSVREMAVSLEVNPNTVMRTYTYLQEKEIIFNKRGIGFFVTENAFKTVHELKKNQFFEEALPRLSKIMDMLGLTLKDIESKI